MKFFTRKENFEKLILNSFSTKNFLLDEDIVSGTNLFNGKKFQEPDSVYYTSDDLLSFGKNSVSIFHLNIRIMNKNLKKLLKFLLDFPKLVLRRLG